MKKYLRVILIALLSLSLVACATETSNTQTTATHTTSQEPETNTETVFEESSQSHIPVNIPYGVLNRADVYSALYSFNFNRYNFREVDILQTYTHPFEDVDNQFYAKAVAWAYSNNLCTQADDDLFAGDTLISKSEIADLLYKYAVMKGVDVNREVFFKSLSAVTDVNSDIVDEFITKSELDVALYDLQIAHLLKPKALPRPNEIDYKQLSFVNEKTNESIHLGMDITSLTVITGLYLVNWKFSADEDTRIQISDNMASMIVSSSPDWSLNGELFVGDSIDRAKSLYGNPIDPYELGLQVPTGGIVYYLDSTFVASNNIEAFEVLLQITFDSDEIITEIIISTSTPYPMDPDLMIPTYEYIQFHTTGEVNEPYQIDPTIDFIFDVSHKGEGDFTISGTEGELFRRTGEYDGRIFLNNVPEDRLLYFESSGEWSLTSVYLNGCMYYDTISGAGDFVHFNVYRSPFAREFNKLKITHQGEGEFTATMKTRYPDAEIFTVATAFGDYEDYVDIPAANPMYYLEIVTDGRWSIEMVFIED